MYVKSEPIYSELHAGITMCVFWRRGRYTHASFLKKERGLYASQLREMMYLVHKVQCLGFGFKYLFLSYFNTSNKKVIENIMKIAPVVIFKGSEQGFQCKQE